MIAETMAGIALVKSAVEGIKSAIGTANDISEIASHIDSLFEGEKQIQQKRIKKQSSTLSVSSVARETIDAKLAQEKMAEMKQLIDFRFGHGTWAGIIAERAKRIQEIKEQQDRIRIQKLKKKEEFFKLLIMVGTGLVAVVLLITAFWLRGY